MCYLVQTAVPTTITMYQKENFKRNVAALFRAAQVMKVKVQVKQLTMSSEYFILSILKCFIIIIFDILKGHHQQNVSQLVISKLRRRNHHQTLNMIKSKRLKHRKRLQIRKLQVKRLQPKRNP